MKFLAFDLEIRHCILNKGEVPDRQYKYCGGWDDKEGMGISLGCAYLSWLKQYKFYDEHNIHELIRDIQAADLVVFFNGFGFDVPLLKATLVRLGYEEKTGMAGKCYDLFRDIQNSHPPEVGRFAKGWKMGQIAEGTLGIGKTGEGGEAPRLWQEGKLAELTTYLLQDVVILVGLFSHAMKTGQLKNAEGQVCQLKDIVKWQNWKPGQLKAPKPVSGLTGSEEPPARTGFKFKPSTAGAAKVKSDLAEAQAATDAVQGAENESEDMPFPEAGL
jgi:hypothetical protein